MPQIDRELADKGLLPFLPAGVYEAATRRTPEFLSAFMEAAILSKGAFYLTKEDFEALKERFPPVSAPAQNPAQPAQNPAQPAQKTRVAYSETERQFFDPDEPCPKEEWVPIKEAYLQEVSALTKKGCSSCQLNALKRKYKKILETE